MEFFNLSINSVVFTFTFEPDGRLLNVPLFIVQFPFVETQKVIGFVILCFLFAKESPPVLTTVSGMYTVVKYLGFVNDQLFTICVPYGIT